MLSFVTVTFNNVDGLIKTYNSILKCLDYNKLAKFEWVVIDGGSQDGTIEFLSGLKNKQFHVTWISEKDNGIYDAMNKGVQLCKNNYVHFLNSGDRLIDGKVFDAICQEDSSDVIFCAVRYNYNGRFYIRKPKKISYCCYGMPANHQGCIYKKEILYNYPYTTEYMVSSDYWLNCVCYKNGFSCSYFYDSIVDFEVGGISTKKYFRVVIDMYRIQRDILNIGFFRAVAFGVRRFLVMTVNYFLHKISLLF